MTNFLTKDDIAKYIANAKQSPNVNDPASAQNPLDTFKKPRATSGLTGPRPPPKPMAGRFAGSQSADVPIGSASQRSPSQRGSLDLSQPNSDDLSQVPSGPQKRVPVISRPSSEYSSISDIANELSYPMQHKLSFNDVNNATASLVNAVAAEIDVRGPTTESTKYAVAEEEQLTSTESFKYQTEDSSQSMTSQARSAAPKYPPVSAFDSALEGSRYGAKPHAVASQKPPLVSSKPQTISVPLYKKPSVSIPSSHTNDPPIKASASKFSVPRVAYDTTPTSSAPLPASISAPVAPRVVASHPVASVPTPPTPTHNPLPPVLTPKQTPSGRVSVPNPLNVGLRCAKCAKPISGVVITAMDKRWHPDCFTCVKCGEDLEHVAFFEHDGLPYCHLDYHELFSPRCEYCKTPIEDNCISALGKTYHPGHFFCRDCGDPFKLDDEGGQYLSHEGHPYCDKCYLKRHGRRCIGCQDWIRGEFVEAMGGGWHRNCFVCKDCKSPFNEGAFYVRDGKPYCEIHFKGNRSAQITCAGCEQSIAGRAVLSMGLKWHSSCFRCVACGRELSASVPGLWKNLGKGGPTCLSCTS